MNILDITLLILLGGFVLFGLFFGFVHTLGSLIGTFVGAFFAGLLHQPLAYLLTGVFGHENLMRIIAFLIIFIVINRLVGFGFFLIEKLTTVVTRLPFLSQINKFLGALLGFIEGVLVLGLSLFVINKYPLGPTFTTLLENSDLLPWFIRSSRVLQLVLPQLLKQLQDVVQIAF